MKTLRKILISFLCVLTLSASTISVKYVFADDSDTSVVFKQPETSGEENPYDQNEEESSLEDNDSLKDDSSFAVNDGTNSDSNIENTIQENTDSNDDVADTAEDENVVIVDEETERIDNSEALKRLEELIDSLPSKEEVDEMSEEEYADLESKLEEIENIADEYDVDLTLYEKYVSFFNNDVATLNEDVYYNKLVHFSIIDANEKKNKNA